MDGPMAPGFSTRIAVSECASFLAANETVDTVVLVAFSKADRAILERALASAAAT